MNKWLLNNVCWGMGYWRSFKAPLHRTLFSLQGKKRVTLQWKRWTDTPWIKWSKESLPGKGQIKIVVPPGRMRWGHSAIPGGSYAPCSSNYKETPDRCELRYTLQDNWPLIFKSIVIMKFKEKQESQPFAIKNIIRPTVEMIRVWGFDGSNLLGEIF